MVNIEKSKSIGVKTSKICDVCFFPLVLITNFGKQVCKKCYMNKEHKKGHSGMLSLTDKELSIELSKRYNDTGKINLIPVTKGNKIFSTLYLAHYPGSKGIVGRSINYLVIGKDGFIIGIIGACSPPLTISLIDQYFDINKTNRKEKINSILNNNVFRLIKHGSNIGTQVLRIFRRTIEQDYYNKYNQVLNGLITFVEPPRKGTVYKADNWKYLGLTKGFRVTKRGNMIDYKKFKHSESNQKLIFALNLEKEKW